MKTPNQIQFQSALATAYADLFANDAGYAFSAKGTTPEALAEKMTDAAISGSANVTGKGFKLACKACGIPHTARAIDAFLGVAAPVKAEKKPVAHKSYMLAAGRMESIMSGCTAAFAAGDSVTLKYSDGSSETAECAETAEAIRNYAKDSRCDAPNFFSVVSAVQSKRSIKIVQVDSSEPALPVNA